MEKCRVESSLGCTENRWNRSMWWLAQNGELDQHAVLLRGG